MSSAAFGNYESAEARAARLLREAMLLWEGARAERSALILRAAQETAVRGDAGVRIPKPHSLADDATPDALIQAAAAMRLETTGLATAFRAAVAQRAQDQAEAFRASAYLPQIRTTPVASAASPASAAPAAKPARDWQSELDRAIMACLADAVAAGIDVSTLDATVAAVRAESTESLAVHTLGRLRESVDAAQRQAVTAARERAEQEVQLAAATAVVELEPEAPRGLADDLADARARVARGEPVPAPEVRRLLAAVAQLEARAEARLRTLNTETSRPVIVEELRRRGYAPVELQEVLTVVDGALVSRSQDDSLAIQYSMDHGVLTLRQVRIGPPSGDERAENLAFETAMCETLDSMTESLRTQGLDLTLTLSKKAVPRLSTKGRKVARATTDSTFVPATATATDLMRNS